MLDEFGNEMDSTESRLDSTMRRVAKVLHLNNGKLYLLFFPLVKILLSDRNQWTAIIVLSVLLVIIIILFVVL